MLGTGPAPTRLTYPACPMGLPADGPAMPSALPSIRPVNSQKILASSVKTSAVHRRTQAALDMWQQLGEGASTPSTILPTAKRPRTGPEPEPAVNAVPVAGHEEAYLPSRPAADQANIAGQSSSLPATAAAPQAAHVTADLSLESAAGTRLAREAAKAGDQHGCEVPGPAAEQPVQAKAAVPSDEAVQEQAVSHWSSSEAPPSVSKWDLTQTPPA